MLTNLAAYVPYDGFVQTRNMSINVSSIDMNNWQQHFNAIFNILSDGIETDFVKTAKIKVDFLNGASISLTIPDYFINLIVWRMIIATHRPIEPEHIFFVNTLTQKSISNYINKNLIIKSRKVVDSKTLNNLIDDTLQNFKYIDKFSLFFANTINFTDDILMMKAIPEYRQLLHADQAIAETSLETANSEGMQMTDKIINYIVNDSKKCLGYEHGLVNAFRSKQSIKPRQYKEAVNSIGTKPDGAGSVFPHIMSHSFQNKGVSEPIDYYIDASAGRTAQIYTKRNTGDSGAYARVLGLNSIDTFLHSDPHYVCDTKNLIKYTILTKAHFKNVIDRYFRWSEDGTTSEDDILITSDMENMLLGKTIYLRSPVTCSSAAYGHGVCYRCYGDTAYTNDKINIGKFAAEEVSAQLTQRLLSAKHLLETLINKIVWESGFFDIFELNGNAVRVLPDINPKNIFLAIDPNDIVLENEDDSYSEDNDNIIYNEYVKKFTIISHDKSLNINKELFTKDLDDLYISVDLNEAIRNKSDTQDGKIIIPLSVLTDKDIFYIDIQNNELSKAMERLMDILNNSKITLAFDKNSIVQAYNDAIIDGDLESMSVHNEILIMNQIRSADNILEHVDWTIPHAKYKILTLQQALLNNPSICITMLYQRLSKTLYSPLSFKKHGVSVVDLFFMKQPQQFIKNENLISNREFKSDKDSDLIKLYEIVK